ncbi:hypothetical protein ACFL3N_03100 [Candidatus Omnitrophota bacterium]
MVNLAKSLLVVGTISLVIAVVSKLSNIPFLGSVPSAIMSFAVASILLAIGLLLLALVEKK